MPPRPDELTNAELEAQIETLTRKLDRLRATYEQYFLGIEKRPPTVQRKDVVRMLNLLTQSKTRNTALRFRLQQQQQKFTTLSAYWSRTEREIENGTYRRHKARVRDRERRREASGQLSAKDLAEVNAIRDKLGEDAAKDALKKRQAQTEAGAAAEDFMRSIGMAPAPKAPPAPAPAAPAPAANAPAAAAPAANAPAPSASATPDASGSQDAMRARLQALRAKIGASKSGGHAAVSREPSPAPAPKAATPQRAKPAPRPAAPRRQTGPRSAQRDDVSRVFDKLVETKKRLNESTAKLSEQGLRKSLAAQRKKVMAKHQCKDVNFDVVVKNGKAYLKPTPVFED